MVDIQQSVTTEDSNKSSTSCKTGEVAEVTEKEPKYPYGSVLFLLSSSVGQSYSGTGLQAVLELYFGRFLFVCVSGGLSHANQLSTAAVNVYIALYQICALSAGVLADRVLGNFFTQALSMLLTTAGAVLLAFSTWQYTVAPPSCCYSNTTTRLNGDWLDSRFNWSTNCSELHKVTILDEINLQISPTVSMIIAIIGLTLFSIGYGHINAIQSVLIADQFSDQQEKSKERSFSWFYWCCNLGALVGESGMPVLRQSVGFVIAWITILASMVMQEATARDVSYTVEYSDSRCPKPDGIAAPEAVKLSIDPDQSVLDVMTTAAEQRPSMYDFKANYDGKYSGFYITSIGGVDATDCCYWGFNYEMPGFDKPFSSSFGVSLVIPGEGWKIIEKYTYDSFSCKGNEKKSEL